MCHKTSIIILSYNTLEMLQLCIESIREHTDEGTYEIIVVENASKDGSAGWLMEQEDLHCIYNEENRRDAIKVWRLRKGRNSCF